MNRAMFVWKTVFVSALALGLVSCAGVRCKVTASRIDQPVSFTPCVYNATGAVIRAQADSFRKHFRIKKLCWAMLWRTVNLTDNNWDLSAELERILAEEKGNAIVNLTVYSQGDLLWYFSSLLPIIPDYHWLVVEGDVAALPDALQ